MTTNNIVHAQLLAGYTGVANKGVVIGIARNYGEKPQRFVGLKGIENDSLVETALAELNAFVESKIAAGYVQISILVSTNIAIYARQAALKAHGKNENECDVAEFAKWLKDHYHKRDAEGKILDERMPSPGVDAETLRLFQLVKGADKVSVSIDDVTTLLRYQVSTEEKSLPSTVKPVKAAKGYELQGKAADGSYYAIPNTLVYASYLPEVDAKLRLVGRKPYIDRCVAIGDKVVSTTDLMAIAANPQYAQTLAGISASMSILVNDLVIYGKIKTAVERPPEELLTAADLDNLTNF